jgi:hypothetical protein
VRPNPHGWLTREVREVVHALPKGFTTGDAFDAMRHKHPNRVFLRHDIYLVIREMTRHGEVRPVATEPITDYRHRWIGAKQRTRFEVAEAEGEASA